MAFEPPTDQEVCDVVEKIANKTIKFLRKKGYLQEEGEDVLRPDLDQLFQDHPGMTEAMAASIQSKIAFGERAGEKVRRVGSGFGYEEETPLVKGTQCATINGFNLHAKVGVAAFARDRLLQLIKYVTRPAISNERLSKRENGDLLYMLKSPWSDGTTAILLSPEELCEKVAALVPPPNSHLTRYSGVFSSHSKWRDKVVPCPEKCTGFARMVVQTGRKSKITGGPNCSLVRSRSMLAPAPNAAKTWRLWGPSKIPQRCSAIQGLVLKSQYPCHCLPSPRFGDETHQGRH